MNYDPVHSLDFAKAVGLDDKQGMIDAINKDLDKLMVLHQSGFIIFVSCDFFILCAAQE